MRPRPILGSLWSVTDSKTMQDVLAAHVANADVPEREWIGGALRWLDQNLAKVGAGNDDEREQYLRNVDSIVRRHLAAYGEIEIPEGLSDDVRKLVERLERSYEALASVKLPKA